MKEIMEKLYEVSEMLHTIPQECKGASHEASVKRMFYMRLRSEIDFLITQYEQL